LGNYVESGKLRVIRLGHDLQSLGVAPTSLLNNRDTRLSGLRVIFVGQLSQRKGISYLLEGFFSAKIPNDSVLTLVGTSVLGSSSYILKKYDSPQLRLEGHLSRSELGDLLGKHDLFVMPSLIEGFCLSAVEALGTGIPVAVTDVVLDDLITHNSNGYVLDKYSATSISQLLEKLCDDKPALINVGRKGSELALNYTWEEYKEEFARFIEEISHSN
jgi:glycosyltransferase involved in cell wall biosynthesis